MDIKVDKTFLIKTKRLVDSFFMGNYSTAFKGTGLEFSDFREYNYGDDTKYIDSVVSARVGTTMVRGYEEERELNILFFFDLSESFLFGDEKNKVSTLMETFYLLAFSAVNAGDKIGALLNLGDKEKFINFRKTRQGILDIFRELEKVDISRVFQENILDLKGLNRLNFKKSLVFVFTDKTDVIEKELKIACLKNDVVVINIFDRFENTLEGVGGIGLKEGFNKMFIDLDDKKKVLEYRTLREKKIEIFRKKIHKYNANYLLLDNKSNIFKDLLGLMKERGR